MPELIESSTFASHRARMSGEFWFKERSTFNKIQAKPLIFVKLFRELCDSILSGLHPFNNIAIVQWV